MREVIVNVTCDLCKQVTGDFVEERKITLAEAGRVVHGTADLCPQCWDGVFDYLRQGFTMELSKPKAAKAKVQCEICGDLYMPMGLPTHKNRKHGIVAQSALTRQRKEQS